MTESGLYCYALAGDLAGEKLAEETGIEGGPLRTVEHEGLVAVVSEVDLAEFGEEGLRRNLEDLAWLEAVATAHDRVVRLVADLAPTAPLRLATIFLSEQGVRDRLVEWQRPARQALDRIRDAREWSVKVYADPAPAAPDPAPGTPVPEGPGAGRAYLLGRRAAAQARNRSVEDGVRAAEAVHERLTAAAADSQRLAPQDRRLTGHVGEMVLNGAYLVPDTETDGFQALIEELATDQPGVRVESAGPWAPYSFARLEDS